MATPMERMIDEKHIILSLKNEESKKDAFKQLMNLYQEKLYYVIRKIVINHDDTADLLQDTFIKIYHKIEDFNEKSSLYTWVYRIAVNEALQFLRKKKRHYNNEPELLLQMQSQQSESKRYSGDEIQTILQQAILMLPEKQRLVFNLKYYDELTYEQIAEITDSSIGSLKASYHHAVKKIENFVRSY